MKSFRKGDRVNFKSTLRGGIDVDDLGTVTADSEKSGYTYVQYDSGTPGLPACSATHKLEYATTLKAETQRRSFCVEIPDPDKFLILSAGTALDEELMRAGAMKIEANGHYGSAYFFTLDEEDVPNVGRFLQIIERHLVLLDLNKEH